MWLRDTHTHTHTHTHIHTYTHTHTHTHTLSLCVFLFLFLSLSYFVVAVTHTHTHTHTHTAEPTTRYTARNFACMSQAPWSDKYKCQDAPPPSNSAENVFYHIWGVIGLLLPAAILVAFWMVQDRPDGMDHDIDLPARSRYATNPVVVALMLTFDACGIM